MVVLQQILTFFFQNNSTFSFKIIHIVIIKKLCICTLQTPCPFYGYQSNLLQFLLDTHHKHTSFYFLISICQTSLLAQVLDISKCGSIRYQDFTQSTIIQMSQEQTFEIKFRKCVIIHRVYLQKKQTNGNTYHVLYLFLKESYSFFMYVMI